METVRGKMVHISEENVWQHKEGIALANTINVLLVRTENKNIETWTMYYKNFD